MISKILNRKRLLIAIILLVVGYLSVTPDLPLDFLKNKYAAAPSKFMALNELRIHYRDEGTGDAIVLVHGTGASLHTWDAWAQEMSQTHRVIRLDLPAYGLTGKDPKKRYSSKDYVDLIDAFLKELDVNQFHLAGNSLGGLVSWLYASYHPDKVQKLILIDPSGFPSKKSPMVISLAKTPGINMLIRYVTPKAFIKKNLKEVYYNPDLISTQILDRYYELTLAPGNRTAFIDRAKIEREDYTDRLGLITNPTLILWGAEDAWIPLKNAYRFEEKIATSTVVVMKETGHLPMEEKPAKSLAITLDFLSN
ncbi:MAG: alpha/beta hydrolase [Flavobacteriaceae bacterium]|jgi:pimeloyl-ACP methyl ester carboxylesterase|nr:alpha/beta hydrolase [Candidatus Arcticimaribacter sp.]